MAITGGLPITTSVGAVIGGIGVSGASSDEDVQCANLACRTFGRMNAG
ncbi:heme-binding protein [Pukyongiella litopenaei]